MNSIDRAQDPDVQAFYVVGAFHTMAGSDTELQKYKQLVALRDELYVENWQKMQKDLNDRLRSRPYNFLRMGRIEDDILRVARIKAFEKLHDVNAADITKTL